MGWNSNQPPKTNSIISFEWPPLIFHCQTPSKSTILVKYISTHHTLSIPVSFTAIDTTTIWLGIPSAVRSTLMHFGNASTCDEKSFFSFGSSSVIIFLLIWDRGLSRALQWPTLSSYTNSQGLTEKMIPKPPLSFSHSSIYHCVYKKPQGDCLDYVLFGNTYFGAYSSLIIGFQGSYVSELINLNFPSGSILLSDKLWTFVI